MYEQDLRNPNFIEVVKRNQEYPERYGRYLGALVYLLTIRAARPKSFWWGGLIGLVTVIGGLVIKYGLPTLAG